jgi:ankyrin repeat protein
MPVNLERDSYGRTAFHMAIKENNKTLVKQYLSNPSYLNLANDPDHRVGDTPLHYAAEYSEGTEIVQLLIENGAKVDAKNNAKETALLRAIHCHNTPVFEYLLKVSAETIVPDGYQALLYAAILSGHTTAILPLIEAGADVNAKKDSNGNTPLHEAMASAALDSKQQSIVDLLLEYGADATIQNNALQTPKAYAQIEKENRDWGTFTSSALYET